MSQVDQQPLLLVDRQSPTLECRLDGYELDEEEFKRLLKQWREAHKQIWKFAARYRDTKDWDIIAKRVQQQAKRWYRNY